VLAWDAYIGSGCMPCCGALSAVPSTACLLSALRPLFFFELPAVPAATALQATQWP
jgi:hypothetical protein